MSMPPLQRNAELFAEGNQCLLALLGCISFEQQLKAVFASKAAATEHQPSEDDEAMVHALLGIVALRQTIERSVASLAEGPVRRAPEPSTEPGAETLSLRALLR